MGGHFDMEKIMKNADVGHRYELQRRVEQFLYKEAELLDRWKVMAWLDLITADIDYRIPIRTTLENGHEDELFSSQAFHMVEDYGSLSARMRRLDGGFAFSESPRSRARRHISNIRVNSQSDDIVEVTSNLLFFWARDELERLISAERRDVLANVDGELRLARRTVFLDHVALPIPNLTVVL